MARQKLVIVGAGLTGSILAARLRNAFDVTVVELSRKPHPLLNEVSCNAGGINTTINRGSGLGGTTNYWHNALIELDPDELRAALIDPDDFAPWYQRAWRLFLDDTRIELVEQIHQQNLTTIGSITGSVAHMVVPQSRANLWELANKRFPGPDVTVVEGTAQHFVGSRDDDQMQLQVRTADGSETRLSADRFIIAAGGLGSPALVARSLELYDQPVGGYHDHPMAYVAKIRLKPGATLNSVSCQDRSALSIRSGFVHDSNGIRSGFYLRPAISLKLKSITGGARYILSDLRNDPFSPRKLLQLLSNPEAIREGLLFKSRAGFRGDYYSILMLGEQQARPDRGITIDKDGRPSLDWRVTEPEHAAYVAGWHEFLDDHRDQIAEVNTVPFDDWEYRTAAHHSGGMQRFQDDSDIHAIADLPGVLVCDGSVLRRGGIANSGLTLAALALRLADRLAPA